MGESTKYYVLAIPQINSDAWRVGFSEMVVEAISDVDPDVRLYQTDKEKIMAGLVSPDAHARRLSDRTGLMDLGLKGEISYNCRYMPEFGLMMSTEQVSAQGGGSIALIDAKYAILSTTLDSSQLYENMFASKLFAEKIQSIFERIYGREIGHYLSNEAVRRQHYQQMLIGFMSAPIAVDIDRATFNYPNTETVECGVLGARNSDDDADDDAVDLLYEGNLYDYEAAITERKMVDINDEDTATFESIAKQNFDDNITQALSVAGCNFNMEHVLDYARESLTERGGSVVMEIKGEARVVLDLKISITFTGITSTPHNVNLDDEFLAMLKCLRIPPLSWVAHIESTAPKYSAREDALLDNALREYLQPLRDAHALNPAYWDFALPPVISNEKLWNLLGNCMYDSSLVIATKLDWDQLEWLQRDVYGSTPANQKLHQLELRDVSVHLHNYPQGAGYYEHADQAFYVLANAPGAEGDLIPSINIKSFNNETLNNEAFDEHCKHAEQIGLYNDAKSRHGIYATYGEYPTLDTALCRKPLPMGRSDLTAASVPLLSPTKDASTTAQADAPSP